MLSWFWRPEAGSRKSGCGRGLGEAPPIPVQLLAVLVVPRLVDTSLRPSRLHVASSLCLGVCLHVQTSPFYEDTSQVESGPP